MILRRRLQHLFGSPTGSEIDIDNKNVQGTHAMPCHDRRRIEPDESIISMKQHSYAIPRKTKAAKSCTTRVYELIVLQELIHQECVVILQTELTQHSAGIIKRRPRQQG